MSRDIVCDSGTLISLTAACLDNLLRFYAEKFDVRFIIPPSVEYETVTRPVKANLRKYLFSALRIQDAIEDGIVIVVDANTKKKAHDYMKMANSMFFIRGKPLNLIHMGESEMLALGNELGIEYLLIDERTTRLLIESPELLKDHMGEEFNVNVMVNKKNYDALTGEISKFKALRSSELVMLAYENGFFKSFGNLEKQVMESAVMKIKYSGCSIRFSEINDYMSKVK